MVWGTNRVESSRLPLPCQEELAEVLAEPIQRIVAEANDQIEKTKLLSTVNMPNARGLLWMASDGNRDLAPEWVWFLLTKVLQKKHRDGSPQYSNIHGLAYFNPRMLVQVPGCGLPALFWFSGTRDPDDQPLLTLLNEMCNAWPKYVSRIQKVPIQRVDKPKTLENISFLGTAPPLPRIEFREQ